MKSFTQLLQEKIVVFDGAMGTNIQVQNLNALIPSGNSWTLGATTLITDQGWILGTANNSADQTAQYILTPK